MPVIKAIMAAALYGLSSPISKLLLKEVSALMMAALVYLGAGLGMLIVSLVLSKGNPGLKEAGLSRKDLPLVTGVIILDIAAPVLMMTGLMLTTPSNAALLGNFEIVATSLIALVVFKEAIGKRLWVSILLITAASIILTFEGEGSLHFSAGSLLVLLACASWGLENNFTRMLSLKDPVQITVIKGLGSGTGALLIALVSKEATWNPVYNSAALILGFFAYGLSIYLYVSAQRDLGAARTSAYYAVAPFIGVGLSFLLFRTPLTPWFLIAFLIMVAGSYLAVSENHEHLHKHEYLVHEHRHRHDDMHHGHHEEGDYPAEHTHLHVHGETEHSHRHTPDLHHRHGH